MTPAPQRRIPSSEFRLLNSVFPAQYVIYPTLPKLDTRPLDEVSLAFVICHWYSPAYGPPRLWFSLGRAELR